MTANERTLTVLRKAVEELRDGNHRKPHTADVARVTRLIHPHLYDGSFTEKLAKMSLFTPEQAEESTAAKREERELEVERVLIHFLTMVDE